ncbi:MAG: hypothetical protein Kow0047_04490 [Anaerolineae bacterium]
MENKRRLLKILGWAVLLLATGVGLAAVVIRSVKGLGVTNLNYIVPWGLWVAFYIYFIGLSAGSFLLSTLIYVFGFRRLEPIGRLALFSALIALIAGLFFVLLDLGHMERFWTVFVHRNLWSVLEIEIHFYVLYIAVLLAELWLLMRRDLIRCAEGSDWRARLCRILALGSRDLSDAASARDHRLVRILGVLGIPIAIGVHGGTGAIFAVVKARPLWYGPLFPIIFIVSALASGAALLTFLLAFFAGRRLDAQERKDMVLILGKLSAGILAFDLLLLWAEYSVGLYGGIPEHVEALRMIMFGPFWWVFWFVQLLFGAIVPIFLILLPATGRNPRWVGLAGLMIVVGIVGVRLNIVIPPLSLPILPGYNEAYVMLPAPSQAVPAYPGWALTWLDRLAVLAALITLIGFGIIGLQRLRRQEGRQWQKALVAVGTAAGGVLIILLGLRWAGGTTMVSLVRRGSISRTPPSAASSGRRTCNPTTSQAPMSG